ncbi:MAG TPA: extracellular solute-binding protein [Casimicrobiaceae bacterium]|nr:extracellular solute-binding protein [Casimicrobiaceae bacterium]
MDIRQSMHRFGWRPLAASIITAVAFTLASPGRAQPAAAPTEMVVAALGGGYGQSIREAFEPFEKQYNVKIRWDVGGASMAMVARAIATRDKPVFDLVFGDMVSLDKGSGQGIWAQIDEKVVTNYKNQVAQAKSAGHDIVYFGFVATGLFYAVKEFEKRGWKPPTHWTDLLDKKYCGRVGINHPNISYGTHVLIMLGGGDPAKVGEGIAKLAAAKDCIPVFEPTAAKLEEKLELGEYVIGVHGSVRVIPLGKKGVPVKFVVPDEGALMYAAGVAPVKNAPHAQLAQQFCNWILRPEVQAQLMEKTFSGPTNATVTVPKPLVELGVPDAELVKRSVFVPPQVFTDSQREWVRQFDRAMQ